jgi:hypothetical protein
MSGGLPDFLTNGSVFAALEEQPDAHNRSDTFKERLTCPELKAKNDSTFSITLDPTYYDYQLCKCSSDTYWNNTSEECVEIPVFKSYSSASQRRPVFVRTGVVAHQQYQIAQGVYPLELAVAALELQLDNASVDEPVLCAAM